MRTLSSSRMMPMPDQRAAWRRLAGLLAMAALMLLQACDDGQGPDAVVHVVELTPQVQVMAVGDTVTLTARPKGPDGTVRTDLPVQWTSRHADLAAIVGTGQTVKVAALRAGLAEISAGTHGKMGVAQLEIRNPVPELAELVPSVAAAGGPDFTLIVRGGRFAPDAQVQWNGVARMTQYVSATELRAVITAADIAAAGTAQVGVLNPLPGGGGSATQPFTIAAGGVAYVEVQPSSVQLSVGESVTLSGSARDIFGRDLQLPVTWSTSLPGIVAVSDAGVVTGLASGSVVVSATTQGGVTGYASVAVQAPPAGVPSVTSITPDSLDSNPNGLEITIRGTGFTEASGAFLNSSSRPSDFISSTELKMYLWAGDVSQSGTPQVRVFNPGNGGGMSNGVPLKIAPGVWSVRIEPASIELWPGQERLVVATAYDEQNRPVTGRAVSWQSGNSSVASVDAWGRVRAVGVGETSITAVIAGRTGSMAVDVPAPLPWDLLYEGNHGGFSELWLLTPGPDAQPRRILPAGTYAADPAASPDGSRIAFVGLDWLGSRNIYVVGRDGSGLQQLTVGMELDDQPAWSRDGTRIAFRSTREGVSDIFVMNADGTDLRNVTSNAARQPMGSFGAERPTWTPDGRIVFSFGFMLLNPQQFRLVSVKADGSDWTELTTGTEFSDFEPEVSPTGQRIALRRSSLQYEAKFIDIIAGDGSQLAWVNLPGFGTTPSWAPDGQSLVYSVSTGPGKSSIRMWSLNSWKDRMLVPDGGRNAVFIPRS